MLKLQFLRMRKFWPSEFILCAHLTMKHGYSKYGTLLVSDIFWVLVLFGYFCMRTQTFQKKKSFSFGYVTKINKSSESSGNMNLNRP